jgi:transposase
MPISLHEGSIKGSAVVEFLQQLVRQIPDPLTIVWDGLGAHRGRLVKEHVADSNGSIQLEKLPAHAPELNPVEYLWAQVKQHELANFHRKTFGHTPSAFTTRAKPRGGI